MPARRQRDRCAEQAGSDHRERSDPRRERRPRGTRHVGARLALQLLLHDVEHRSEERAHRALGQRAVVRRSELLEELCLAFRVDQSRPGGLLVVLHLGDELEPAIEGVEQVAIERRDLLAELGQLRWRVHACSLPAGADRVALRQLSEIAA